MMRICDRARKEENVRRADDGNECVVMIYVGCRYVITVAPDYIICDNFFQYYFCFYNYR